MSPLTLSPSKVLDTVGRAQRGSAFDQVNGKLGRDNIKEFRSINEVITMCAVHIEPTSTSVTRRNLVTAAAAAGASVSIGNRFSWSASEQSLDFTKPLNGWVTVSGKWAIEEVEGASQDGHALVQRATDNDFNVIVAPGGPYDNVDVSVRFKPISGREDASAGIVFRFSEGRYYVIRANALENNFNFYYYDRGRREIAGASVNAPALGQWHKMRITAVGDRIQGWLNEQALIDRRDSRFKVGSIGLWTKADSITAFDGLTVSPVNGG